MPGSRCWLRPRIGGWLTKMTVLLPIDLQDDQRVIVAAWSGHVDMDDLPASFWRLSGT